MSHFLTVPINENGIIVDDNIDLEIETAAVPPFRFTDVFIYSHGWWNTATRAVSEYNVFSIGFSKALQVLIAANPADVPKITAGFSALAMGLHWPTMLSEDQNSVANFLEATSFFTMEHRADDVGEHGGYSLLRLLIEARQGQPPLRFHLIGHSFGCRVLCSALQTLAADAQTLSKAQAIHAEFNLALLQAAMDADSFVNGNLYGDVLTSIPNLRLLVTTSHNDTALGTWYPAAQKLASLFRGPVPAMGFVGPSEPLALPVSDRFSLQTAPAPLQAGRFAVVNLTPLHDAHSLAWNQSSQGWGGQHSDINLPEIYECLARFFGN
jgi:hypothetical protein